MPLAVNYVKQFEGSWLQIQIDGNDASCCGLDLKPFLLTSAMLSGSFQILLHSLHFRFMDSWFQKKNVFASSDL